jgi:hypothetical protein
METEYERLTREQNTVVEAYGKYRHDPSFRHKRDHAVHLAMAMVPREKHNRESYLIAEDAATMMLAIIYHEDAELMRLKAHNEYLENLAKDALALAPMRPLVQTKKAAP